MKIRVYSDLHIEFAPFEPAPEPCDLVVLAGDIHINRRGLEWAAATFPETPIVYVMGNHEYFGRALPKLTDELKDEAEGSNVHILERDVFHLGRLRVLGCTLWTDFALFGDARIAAAEAEERMTDFKRIRVSPGFHKLRSIDTMKIHAQSFTWLSDQLMEPHDGPTVVVTHHAPSRQSLPDGRKTDLLSAAYASSCEQLINRCGPQLWIHGHVHHRNDYVIGRTRVVSNPRGYDDEPVADFDPVFNVELDS